MFYSWFSFFNYINGFGHCMLLRGAVEEAASLSTYISIEFKKGGDLSQRNNAFVIFSAIYFIEDKKNEIWVTTLMLISIEYMFIMTYTCKQSEPWQQFSFRVCINLLGKNMYPQ